MSRDRMRLVGMMVVGAVLLAAPVAAQSGSPPTSHDPADPLLETLLQVGQLPSSLQAGTIDEPPAFDIVQAAFDANAGLRAFSRTWTGTRGPVLSVTDFRMLFPSAAQASAYLDAAEPVLSEQVASGLAPVMFEDPIGEDARHFFGVAEVDGRTLLLHDYLFRVGPIAAKVFVVGVDMREDTASNLAGAARARMALIESARDPLHHAGAGRIGEPGRLGRSAADPHSGGIPRFLRTGRVAHGYRHRHRVRPWRCGCVATRCSTTSRHAMRCSTTRCLRSSH